MKKTILLTGAAALLCGTGLQAQTVLPNGICLPEPWPPRYEVPVAAKEMPVPYLLRKPETIRIDRGRQLFVDDFLIRQTDLQRVYHNPAFYAGNPVLEPDKEWEKTAEGALYASPFSDGVWYDEREGKFKMWYLAGAGSVHRKDNQTFYTGYAESADGKHWIKKECEVLPGTNIVDTDNRDASTVWLDKAEPDRAKRYKMFAVLKRPDDKRWQLVLKYSADGIHWSRGAAQSGGDIGDRSTAFFNPFTGKWALSLRAATSVSGRSRDYAEHADPEMLVSVAHKVRRDIPDKHVVFWFTPDDKEPRHPDFPEVHPGIYNFDAIAYESIVLGFYSVWQGPENNICNELGIQKRNELILGYSRDGFHFYRPSHRPFMGVNPSEGAWNWGNMQSVAGVPLIVGDSLYFYSSGRRLNRVMWDSYTSTGLATLRRDGFVSLHTAKKGFVSTEKVAFEGKYLFVNADVRGKLEVEITDESGSPVPGFTRAECIPVKKTDKTKIAVSWKNNRQAGDVRGRQVYITFYLEDADLYAFWVSSWESGESRGYTAGGGPGLKETGVDSPE